MTDKETGRRALLSPLGVRLAAAFVIVAVAGVAVLGILSAVAARDGVSSLIGRIHADDARAAATAAADAYEQAGSWEGADLTPAGAVAARGQATLTVTDAAGGVIAAPADEAAEMMARMHGVEILDVPRDEPISEPVMIDGAQVGVVALRFPSSHLPTPERQARDAIARTIVVGGVLATAVAVVVAVFIARQVTAPVSALTAAAVAFESGRREVRVNRPDAPGELGALSAAFDRMAAAVEHEDRLRRQLVADVAHEVRTPLTVIRATSEGLVDGALPATQATFESLHEEVLRLTQLVADLEILAAADAAGLHLDRAPIDLADIAADAVAAVTALTSEQNVALTTELAPAPTVGDERRIRQIISNIVLNALHYAPPGSPIRVEAGHLPNGGAFARVTDTGSGLSDEDIAHVFDRFYRGSAAAGTEGSGIGLAIGSELAGAHGGSLTAENAPDGGAVFTLTLPPIRPT